MYSVALMGWFKPGAIVLAPGLCDRRAGGGVVKTFDIPNTRLAESEVRNNAHPAAPPTGLAASQGPFGGFLTPQRHNGRARKQASLFFGNRMALMNTHKHEILARMHQIV